MGTKRNIIDELKVLPVMVQPNSTDCHSIFMKEHFSREFNEMKPKGRTLFLTNIPPYVTAKSLKLCFEKVGKVLNVLFYEKPGKNDNDMHLNNNDKFNRKTGTFIFKTAFVVFKYTKSVQSALNMQTIKLFDNDTKECYINTGLEKFIAECIDNIQNENELQELIDNYMKKFDMREKLAIENEKTAKINNDGWITVGKDAGFDQTETSIQKLKDKFEKKQKQKELKNFYTFQIRESKMQNIVSLRKKFEEDKNKIEMLKKNRRFKPY